MKKPFHQRGPVAYAIYLQKRIWKRHLRDWRSRDRFAVKKESSSLPAIVWSHSGDMIKRGPGIDPVLQRNKVDNIRLACSRIDGVVVRPGETFSFWKLVGRATRFRGYSKGRVIVGGRLTSGYGGGLCNLAHTLCLLMLHSPMTITELHHHSDALAPDPGGIRVPYGSGTSVSFNVKDLRFRNDTNQPVQIRAWCDGDFLHAEMRTTEAFPFHYRITEEGHHFHQEGDKFYRISRIYRETYDSATGTLIDRKLHWDNHSTVMFDPALIPADQIS